MLTKASSLGRSPRQAPPDLQLTGLSAIARALAALVGHPIDRSTVARWMAPRGIRGHRIAGRRVGNRWVTDRAALVAFARESGALREGS